MVGGTGKGTPRRPLPRLPFIDIGAPARGFARSGAPPPSDAVTDNPARVSTLPLSIRYQIAIAGPRAIPEHGVTLQ
ncbi:hypothetical protein DLE60_07225 [Micromonospora globispora]|nr:hypothetical protein DLE60_07225 [Micromonospora globispora]RQW93751.1 hypothetical protein DKL51_16835 [Micromonospora globispora]